MSSTVNSAQNPSSTPGAAGKHHQIVIVGGGAAGITVAAQLLKQSRSLDVAIIEPSAKHDYQPGWTLVGGGVAPLSDFVRDEKAVIPPGAKWLQTAVASFDPAQNTLTTIDGQQIHYDYLVVCPGIQINWHLIKGLKEALGKGGVTSNYSKEFVPYTWETIQNFKGGNAIFTHPATPIKCGGAPQKIMYMADDAFKNRGLGSKTNVTFCIAGPKMFPIAPYSATLDQVVARRGITPKFLHNLKEIKADTKEAVFDVTSADGVQEVTLPYDMIHVTPPMSPPDFIKQSPLANEAGWVDVHKHTLQHNRYPNVFSLGDASSLPTSKTAAAARKQAPVLVHNLLAVMNSQPCDAQYNGYTCCPLITGYQSAMMAEFDYDGNLTPSFPLDPTKERYIMYLAKVHVLPWLYWNRMLAGESFEADVFKPLKKLAGW